MKRKHLLLCFMVLASLQIQGGFCREGESDYFFAQLAQFANRRFQ